MTTPNRTPVKVGLVTAVSLVVASMIGTGIFTSVGFQVEYLDSPFALLFLWAVGGGMALCGALAYGELGAALPRSGGEYHLVSELYHPSLGFIVGWITATLGFAGPIALSAIAFGDYTTAVFPGLSSTHLAAGIVVLTSAIHGTSITYGSWFQNAFTGLKVLLILVFVAAAAGATPAHNISVVPSADGLAEVASAGFAVSLVFVTYAYAGWNSAIYIVGEVRAPQRNVPRALVLGTALVTVLYVLLTFVFLYTVPTGEMAGEVEVGYLAGRAIFGDVGGQVVAIFIALILVSSVSAMVYLGPRVTQAMVEDAGGQTSTVAGPDRGQGENVLREVQSSFDSLQEVQSEAEEMSSSLSHYSERIAANVGEVVSSVQFHDIVRQQIEHISWELEEIEKEELYDKLWQVFCVFIPIKTVGIMGDYRTYENLCAIRAVESKDAMTASFAKLDWNILERIATRIINEVQGFNRVVYDISNKPPSTIEFE